MQVKEYKAEQWAHERMPNAGIAVPRSMTERARNYDARKIGGGARRTAKHIDTNARRFAQTGMGKC